jgi:hypothetical protein
VFQGTRSVFYFWLRSWLVDILDDAPKIDFKMKLKSTGLNELIRYLCDFEKFPNKQKQETYRQKIRDCLRIVLINLANTAGYISYSRNDHAPKYQPKKYSPKNIGRVVDFLEENGFVENKPGCNFPDNPKISRWSRMRPLNKLQKLFETYGINQSDILIDTKKDLIILRDESKRPVSYPDTPFTLSARENLKKINELSAYHSIVDGKGLHIHRKAQHRVFNRDFQHGGRFYGGEWQSLSGNDRLKLKIDNSPMLEYDFDEYHPTILYAISDIPIEGDLYSLNGYSPESRPFFKFVMLALINTNNKTEAKKAIQWEVNKWKIRKPKEATNISDPINDFIDKHEPIAHLFCSDMGLQLQRLDSDICESVQMHFYQRDILALGVHDSFIIRQDYGKMLCEIMEEVFFNKFNKKCKITKKG